MADINRVILVGRLTRDAELRYTGGGMAVCKFSIAINRRKRTGERWEDEAHFFDVVLFGKQGEAINQYLVKGKQVGIDGELLAAAATGHLDDPVPWCPGWVGPLRLPCL